MSRTSRSPRRHDICGFLVAATALLITAVPFQAFAESLSPAGAWRLVGNRYASHVELRIDGGVLHAEIGCLDVVYEVEFHGSALTLKDGIVRETACRRSDARNPAAQRYWTELSRRLDGATSFERRGKSLTFRGASGSLRFTEIR